MRLLLTSAGISNPSIHDALVDLLGNRSPSQMPSLFPPRYTPSRAVLIWPGRRSAEKPNLPYANWVGSP
jgi:hypothetical protein